jgi:hypothetical protein
MFFHNNANKSLLCTHCSVVNVIIFVFHQFTWLFQIIPGKFVTGSSQCNNNNVLLVSFQYIVARLTTGKNSIVPIHWIIDSDELGRPVCHLTSSLKNTIELTPVNENWNLYTIQKVFRKCCEYCNFDQGRPIESFSPFKLPLKKQ